MNRVLSLLFALLLLPTASVYAQFVQSAVGGLSVTPRIGMQGYATAGVDYEPKLSYGLTVGYGLSERLAVALATDYGSVDSNDLFHADLSVRFTQRRVLTAWRPYVGLGLTFLSLDVGESALDGVGPKIDLGVAYFVTPSLAVDVQAQIGVVETSATIGGTDVDRTIRSGRLTAGVSFYLN